MRGMTVAIACGLMISLAGVSTLAHATYDEATATRVIDLSVDGLPSTQFGLGDPTPTLAWRLASTQVDGNPCFSDAAVGVCGMDKQEAYQVRAASSAADLTAGPWLWDTGKVDSSDQSVTFGGTVGSRASVVWQARVWDANGYSSAWSDPSQFTIGLLNASDWSAQWIEDPAYTYQTNGVPNPLPVFASEFSVVKTVASAMLYATGLGQFTATINGLPIGDAVLEPGQTGYWDEVDYRAYDVTTLVTRGANVVGMEVGSGAYQQADNTSVGRYGFQASMDPVMGTPKVRAQLEVTFTDGTTQTVATNASWLARSGPTTFSSWWGGEDYDARILPTGWTGSTDNLLGSAWHHARVSALDGTTIPRADTPMVANPRPPVTVAEEAQPVSITTVHPDAATTSIVASAQAGATTLKIASATGIFTGDGVQVAGDHYTVTSVGTSASPATTLASDSAIGDTTINVANVGGDCSAGGSCDGTTNFIIGQPIVIGAGATEESVTVTGVTHQAGGGGSPFGPPTPIPGTVTITPALHLNHATDEAVQGEGTGIGITPALAQSAAQGTALTSDPQPAYVLDFGRNLVGLLQVSGEEPSGTTVTLLGSEGPQPPTDYNSVNSTGLYDYTFAGTGVETWHTQFTYNGQRFVVVRGLPDTPTKQTVTLLVTHADNTPTATFSSCDTLLSSIYDITKLALENNMQSVMTDCPNREKGPYTGDNLHNIDTELTLYDMAAFEGQLVMNMNTSQRPNAISDMDFPDQLAGLIANIAPEYHAIPPDLLFGLWFLDEPNWGGAIIRIPWALYETYGDTSVMAANYDAMVKWMGYEAAQIDANGRLYGLGDWSAGQTTDPAQAIIDAGYYEGAAQLALIAGVLGKSADAARYTSLAAQLKDEYNTAYLHVDSASGAVSYANDTEASNAIALDAGLVPDQYRDAVFASLVGAVEAYDYKIGTGSPAMGALFRALHAGGRDDLLFRMVTSPDAPSYAYLVGLGETTLTEDLSGGGSQDHHFLGEVGSWLIHDLVGIDQPSSSIGYGHLLIKPATGKGIDDIPCLDGAFTTSRGLAENKMTRTGSDLTMDVTIPGNTTAEVWVPTTSGDTVLASSRATYLRVEDGYTVYSVGAGEFTFESGPDVTPPPTPTPTPTVEPTIVVPTVTPQGLPAAPQAPTGGSTAPGGSPLLGAWLALFGVIILPASVWFLHRRNATR